VALLDQVKQMQEQGMADQEISKQLAEQGNSSKDINDAINQSHIRSAIDQETPQPSENIPQAMQQQGLQPSSLDQEAPQPTQEQPQQTQEAPVQDYSQQPYQDYQTGYEQYQYPQYSGESASEIAEQVVDEKLSSIKKNLTEATEIKTEFETKFHILENRVKKIEDTIDKLESSILQRIGEYSKGILDIKAETRMMRESFSKTISKSARKSKTKRKSSKKK
jgi:hypothetical protein